MAKEIKTIIEIQASLEKVWAILMDFEAYPSWNPFIKSITGVPIKGRKITARIEPPGAKGMTFKPTVTELQDQKVFQWLGHLGIPGLFDGEHRFELIENGDGSTKLIHSEKFRGILVPLFKKMLDENTLMGFKAMNEALKQLAEGKAVKA